MSTWRDIYEFLYSRYMIRKFRTVRRRQEYHGDERCDAMLDFQFCRRMLLAVERPRFDRYTSLDAAVKHVAILYRESVRGGLGRLGLFTFGREDGSVTLCGGGGKLSQHRGSCSSQLGLVLFHRSSSDANLRSPSLQQPGTTSLPSHSPKYLQLLLTAANHICSVPANLSSLSSSCH